MRKVLIVATAVIAMGAITIGVLYANQPKTNTAQTQPSSDIVSKEGIHWHPHLSIYVRGQKQEIPANIGIGKQYSSSKWYDSMMDMTDSILTTTAARYTGKLWMAQSHVTT